ncbi:hypothetical protein [Deinococcus multiflagellatus]|uniref:Uncharacterized protein n=1 Tax=Deinococcus multiflagellatus TaxID=1656887 RepID=A0ABW1ZSD5_9DEIO
MAYYLIRNNQVQTDVLATSSNNGGAAAAALTVQTEGQLTFSGSTGYYLNALWLSASISNPSNEDMTGVEFTAPWDDFLPIEFDAERSYSTCGGTLSGLAGEKVLFSAAAGCQVWRNARSSSRYVPTACWVP